MSGPKGSIVEFLRARLDEDEAAALANVDGRDVEAAKADNPSRFEDRFIFERLIISVGRVLREVEAKRQIVAEHWPEFGNCPRCVKEPPERDDEGERLFVAAAHPCATLRLLALPYADHPDYQREWAP